MTIAESLKRFRTSRGLTFGSAAAAFGKARTAWYSYEKGNAIPPVTAIIAVAREFGVSTDYLLGLTDDPTPYWANQENSVAPEKQTSQPCENSASTELDEIKNRLMQIELALKETGIKITALEN